MFHPDWINRALRRAGAAEYIEAVEGGANIQGDKFQLAQVVVNLAMEHDVICGMVIESNASKVREVRDLLSVIAQHEEKGHRYDRSELLELIAEAAELLDSPVDNLGHVPGDWRDRHAEEPADA